MFEGYREREMTANNKENYISMEKTSGYYWAVTVDQYGNKRDPEPVYYNSMFNCVSIIGSGNVYYLADTTTINFELVAPIYKEARHLPKEDTMIQKLEEIKKFINESCEDCGFDSKQSAIIRQIVFGAIGIERSYNV